jgi:isoquinoline 1-oxidoreductase beta subunit
MTRRFCDTLRRASARQSGKRCVNIEKLTVVVDAGTPVDPDGALAQVERGTLRGLSMTLHEGTEFVKGQIEDTNLDTYTPLRMGDVLSVRPQFFMHYQI